MIGLLSVLACRKDDPAPVPDPVAAGPCHPLSSTLSCLLPYPSDHWLDGDGVVALPDEAVPDYAGAASAGTQQLDFPARDRPRGFSPISPILAGFDEPWDASVLPTLVEPLAASLDGAAHTFLIRADTGERVLHLAEPDAFASPDVPRALVIRPMERLADGARYVVGVRGLTTPDGEPLEPPEGFRALLAGDAPADAQARWDDEVFPVLEAQGASRDTLQLAWDFTVRSREDAAGDMLAARAIAVEWLATHEAIATVDEVQVDPDPRVALRISGHLRAPLVVTVDGVGAELFRDAGGEVVQNGEVDVPFLLTVPPGALDGGGRALQFGHGFFGGKEELDSDFCRTFGDTGDFVAAAVDWQGMSRTDLVAVTGDMLNDVAHTFAFADRVHQAVVNQIVLARALKTSLAALPELRATGGGPVYDPTEVYFYGISQGHILGSVYVAMAPDVRRAVLGSGGAGFTTIMFRGLPFEDFASILEPGLVDSQDLQEFHALAQTSFDPIDPAEYAPWLLDESLPDGPGARAVLMQLGEADTQVPTVAGRLHARMLGLPLLEPIVEPVDGLSTVAAPTRGSAVVEFSFGVPQPWPGTVADLSWEENEVHGAVRMLPASMAQADAFLRPDGRIEATCDGPCDPE